MQVARRRDPYPWTWEPFALWALMLLMFVVGTSNLGWMLVIAAVMALSRMPAAGST